MRFLGRPRPKDRGVTVPPEAITNYRVRYYDTVRGRYKHAVMRLPFGAFFNRTERSLKLQHNDCTVSTATSTSEYARVIKLALEYAGPEAGTAPSATVKRHSKDNPAVSSLVEGPQGLLQKIHWFGCWWSTSTTASHFVISLYEDEHTGRVWQDFTTVLEQY